MYVCMYVCMYIYIYIARTCTCYVHRSTYTLYECLLDLLHDVCHPYMHIFMSCIQHVITHSLIKTQLIHIKDTYMMSMFLVCESSPTQKTLTWCLCFLYANLRAVSSQDDTGKPAIPVDRYWCVVTDTSMLWPSFCALTVYAYYDLKCVI